MSTKKQAMDSLVKIQVLLGELGYTLDKQGYYKDYGILNGSLTRITPIFDKGISIDLQYNLSALSIAGHEIISIIHGQPVALDKIPGEARADVMRMLAELAPGALLPKFESFILTMSCATCKEVVSSFFSNKGEVQCLKCLGYEE